MAKQKHLVPRSKRLKLLQLASPWGRIIHALSHIGPGDAWLPESHTDAEPTLRYFI